MKKWLRVLCVVLVVSFISKSEAADRTWLPAAGGSYEWQNTANWAGGVVAGTVASDQAQMRTTGQTSDQTIHLGSPVNLDSFYPGSLDLSPYAQIFTGEALTPSTNFRIMGGNAVFENTVNVSGGNHYVGYVYKAGLTLRESGILSFTNGASLSVGHRFHASYPGGPGSLFIDDQATFRMRGSGVFSVGYSTKITYPLPPGKVWQSGGLFDAEAYWLLGISADGYYRLDGGSVDLPALASQTHRIGNGGPIYGLLHVSDGTFNLSGNAAGSNGQFHLGSQTASTTSPAYSEVYLNGGTLNASLRPIVLASWTTGASDTVPHEAILTVDGDAELYARNIGLGNTASSAVKASLNLNGGLCSLTYYLSVFGGANNQAFLNFNGGTLQWRSGPGTGGSSPLGSTPYPITIYPKGGTLDTTGTTIMTDKPFRAAGGYGVSGVTLTSGGNNYGAAPRVAISGGSGSNATAVAIMNRDGSLARVAVTCPGEGYTAGDTLAVSFVANSGYGSGAAATVVLAENTPGTFTKMGGGTWQVTQPNTFESSVKLTDGQLNLIGSGSFPALSALQLTGGIFHSYSNQNDRINPSAALELAGGGYAPVYRSVRPAEGFTNTQHFAVLSGHPGLADIDSIGGAGVSELHFGTYGRTGSLISFSPVPSNRLWMAADVLTDGSPVSPSTVSPVVAGFISADGMDLLERDSTSGYLQTAALSGSIDPDSNFLVPAGVTNVSGSVVNSLVFDDVGADAELYFQTTGAAQVRSGMIASRSSQDTVKSVGTLAGGTLTTAMPGGMVFYDRENSDRRESSAYGGRYLISTSLADPAPATPMAVTIAGERVSTVSGSLVRFMQDNTFSGGLYLANGGLWYDGDAMLGAAGAPVVAAGLCALRPAGTLLETAADRPIEIRQNSALQLLGTAGDCQVASRIRGPLSGEGSLLTGEYVGSGYKTVAELTGDNNAFTGSYYIFGAVRASEGVGLSTNANIRFADNTGGLGTLDMSGTFTRPLGDGPGAVCWKQYPGLGALYGGFSAYGGPLTVNLHGDARTLEWGSAYLPSGAVLYLQNRMANNELTFMNGIDLNGLQTPHIRVSTDLEKTAYFNGVISDSVGGGTLIKGGQGILVLAQSPTFDGKLSILSGIVRLAQGVSLSTLSEVSITGDGRALQIMGTQDVQNVTCKITGTGSVTISDGGTTVMSGTNTYSGTTVVANGSTLLVDGEHNGGGNYDITGTLGGTGIIAPAAGNTITLGPGSVISPGGPGAIGTLTLGSAETTNTVALSSATLEIDLDAVSSDKVVVAGDLSISGSSIVTILSPDVSLLASLRGTVITICEWTGEKAGTFIANTNVEGWKVIENLAAKTIALSYVSPGTVIILK